MKIKVRKKDFLQAVIDVYGNCDITYLELLRDAISCVIINYKEDGNYLNECLKRSKGLVIYNR